MTKANYDFTEQEAKYRAMTDEQLTDALYDIRKSLDFRGWYGADVEVIHAERARRAQIAAELHAEHRLFAAAAREEAMLISSGLEYIGNYDAAELKDGLHVVDDQLVRINSGNPEPLDGNDLAVFDAMLAALRAIIGTGADKWGYVAASNAINDSIRAQAVAAIARAEAIR